MSVPCGSAAPFSTLDRRTRDELLAHRAKVFAALSQHSDPALRELGRLLAADAASPQQLREDPLHADKLRRIARKLKEVDREPPHREKFGPEARPNGGDEPFSGPYALFDEPPRSNGSTHDRAAADPSRSPSHRSAGWHGSRGSYHDSAGADRSRGSSHDLDGTGRSHEAGPASRPIDPDPDNGAGGVPAIRR